MGGGGRLVGESQAEQTCSLGPWLDLRSEVVVPGSGVCWFLQVSEAYKGPRAVEQTVFLRLTH